MERPVSWILGADGGRADEAEWETWADCHEEAGLAPCVPPRGAAHAENVRSGALHLFGDCPACAEAGRVFQAAAPPAAAPAVNVGSVRAPPPPPASPPPSAASAPPPPPPPRQPRIAATASSGASASDAGSGAAAPARVPVRAAERPLEPLQPPTQWHQAAPEPPQPSTQWHQAAPELPQPRMAAELTRAAEYVGSLPFSALTLDARQPTGSRPLRTLAGSCAGVDGRVTVHVFPCGALPGSDCVSLAAEVDVLRDVHHPFLARVHGASVRPRSGGSSGGGHDGAEGFELLLVRQWAPQSLADAVAAAVAQAGPPRGLVAWHLQALHAAALGLCALHDRPGGGLIHGDVRASRILLNPADASARLADYGLSRLYRAVERGGDDSGDGISGERSTQWRAPELFSRSRVLSPRTDVYAFGVMLYEVLTGLADPYEGAWGPPPRCLIALVCAPDKPLRPRLDALPPDTPAALTNLMTACWAAHPASRPSMGYVARVLADLCGSYGMGAAVQAANAAHERAQDEARARAGSAGARAKEAPSWSKRIMALLPLSASADAAALVARVDEDDMPLAQAAAAAAYTRAAAAPAFGPRVTITPVWDADPPLWEPPATHSSGCIPPVLDSLLLPFPPSKSSNVVAAVTVPFYSEDGYALRRTLEALALQAADMRTAAIVMDGLPQSALPELHVFAIADGWSKDDGTPILSKSMLAEILDLYGPSLDADALIDLLSSSDDGEAQPAGVLLQFATPAPGGRGGAAGLVLAPVVIDCSWALAMEARAHAPPGAVVRAVTAARKSAASSSGYGSGMSAPLLESWQAGAPSAAAFAAAAPVAELQPLFVTLLIKRRNAKKHHSHRWHFEAFAPVTRLRSGKRCEFIFATDAGTLYAPFCLAELIHHMQANPRAAAATAHQRIMAKADQLDPQRGTAEPLVASLLRDIQCYDFESGLVVFNGTHALAGFLPVVPGPCGLFRCAALSNDIIERVRRICTSPAEQDGLIVANLKIAEDRILSYLLVLVPDASTGESWETHWVPSTAFFFESEATLKEFVLQRRRWLNGTVAGYMWVISQPSLWMGACLCRGKAWSVFFLASLQLLVFLIVFLSPGMFLTTTVLAVGGVADLAGVRGGALTAISVLTAATFASTFVVHVVNARVQSSFVHWSWWTRVILNACAMVVITLTSLVFVAIAFIAPSVLNNRSGAADVRIALSIGAVYASTPFFLAALHSRESLLSMVRSAPTFTLFTPTIIGDLFAYAVARADDVSWGTKQVSGTSTAGVGGLAERAAAHAQARRAAHGDGSGSGALHSRRAALAATLRSASAREASACCTTVVSTSQVIACLSLATANYLLAGVPHYLLAVGLSTAAVGGGIMLASLFYFCGRNLCSSAATPARAALTLGVVAAWLVVVVACAVISLPGLPLAIADAAGAVIAAVYAVLTAAVSVAACCSAGGKRKRRRAYEGDEGNADAE